jgi:hypothetical protein
MKRIRRAAGSNCSEKSAGRIPRTDSTAFEALFSRSVTVLQSAIDYNRLKVTNERSTSGASHELVCCKVAIGSSHCPDQVVRIVLALYAARHRSPERWRATIADVLSFGLETAVLRVLL